ncbi:NO signaling/Golgi transport ligand-binding domain-containing protein [Naematelia encephala]|uniref:NO signaling/Golgi transport ligand-binding domain-containing protein n=1 Tax=Naematelia encephala TaxID=71784 RepID=A0A1Y2BLF4_9TREE|nr:NO signaling/Golgi transport ligand-binding domain-containing protein [Naematelia encephala]
MSTRPSTSSSAQPTQIAPTVPPPIHILANPIPALIDSQLPSYLLPYVIDAIRQSTAHVMERKKAQEDELRAEGLLPPLEKGKGRASPEEIEDEALKKVERIGLMVGGFIAVKLTLARPPLANHLDIIKFICKDLFLYIYSKQIDNLRTNHRGVYVLQSNALPPLIPLSSYGGASADLESAKAHLVFPQALIQGALTRLGMPTTVIAESSGLPQCTFQIRTIKPGASGTGTPSMSTPGQGQAQAQGQGQSRPVDTPPLSQARTGLGIAGAGP